MIYKDFDIVAAKMSPNLYEINWTGPGKLAESLTGLYSSTAVAKQRIDLYLEGRLARKNKNATISTES